MQGSSVSGSRPKALFDVSRIVDRRGCEGKLWFVPKKLCMIRLSCPNEKLFTVYANHLW